MKKSKKIVSLTLALIMLLTAVPVLSFAQEEAAYVPAYDKDTPVVLLHGIGQNDTYVVDDEGNVLKDNEGGDLTVWPLEIDVKALVSEVLPSLLMSVFTRRDAGLTDAFRESIDELLYAYRKDNEGNYLNNVYVPSYQCSMAELPESYRKYYYGMLPMYTCAEVVGNENLYIFGYDSLGDIEETTDLLHKFITETVLPQTGAEKVNLCPISLGGTLAVSYLEMYKQDYDLIKKMVYVIPAMNGSDIVGDILTGNLSTEENSALYGDLLVKLLGDKPAAHLLGLALRVLLPSEVLKDAVQAVAEGVVITAVRPTTQLWALCPTEYYPQAREKWLMDDEFTVIREKVDAFMKARENFPENLAALTEKGAQSFSISCYDLELFPLTAGYKTTNSDGIIQSSSTSMGATFSKLGETLGENYIAKGTYCTNPDHNHLSPDGEVDATTGLLPETTWYFKGQSHEGTANNKTCIDLACYLLCDDNLTDVYANPAYPQFMDFTAAKTEKEFSADAVFNFFAKSATQAVDGVFTFLGQ
ncbi:MAG: hypothetical protein IKV21_04855 [Clostridia bacterium]|nr:hypothetical protein [Clostridia bacterium]